ncbi:hypothetical protein MMC28_010593 [Mycoblastus sanguinarius]|nr:hypothetical protein [Mycoblastus sanguinarius]
MSFHFEDGDTIDSGYDDSRSRECTPYVSRPPELELHLQFDPGPKDATQVFVFGTDEEDCDVKLLENPDKNNRYGISRQHFLIDFNWNSGFLRLNNMSSTNGTGMTAPSVNNGFQSLKYNNMHMLHPAEQTRVQVGTLVFEICFPARGKHQRQHDRNWDIYRRSHQGRRNAYLLHGDIGTGQFGFVRTASDPRTGELFAAKQFVTRKPGWDAKAYLEVAISQDITHEHIVSFVDLIDDGGGPALVMKYLTLGNLSGLEKISLSIQNERKTILDKMKKHTKVDAKRVDVQLAICGSWGDDVETDRPQDQDYLAETGVYPLFIAVRALPKPVMIRRLDLRVNSSQILGVTGRNESDMVQTRTEYRGAYNSVQHGGSKYMGTYIDFEVAIDLCRKYSLVGLESQIRQVRLEEQLLQETIPERVNSEMQPGDTAG